MTPLPQIIRQVEKISIRVQKELVLLHGQGVDHPTGTMKWLNALGWLSSYFHVNSSLYTVADPGEFLGFRGTPLLSFCAHASLISCVRTSAVINVLDSGTPPFHNPRSATDTPGNTETVYGV